jgi:predicted TPR repeat methyltransferase
MTAASATTPAAPAAPSTTESVHQAMEVHRGGDLATARAMYERLLAAQPRHADALHLLGVLEAQQGHAERAAELIAQALAINPDEPMFRNNMGNVCVELGRDEDAQVHYTRAIELDPRRVDVLNNLGVLLGRHGQAGRAEQLLQRAIALAPSFSDARQNLANLYLGAGRMAESVQQRAGDAGGASDAPGPREKAMAVYREWLRVEPGNPLADYHLRACTGEGAPDRAPDAYVQSLFDHYARSFDASLARLGYQAPQLIAAAVARHAGTPARQHDIVDAGCGTGLVGALAAPWARHLAGVDLSQGMLAQAQARQVYDELAQGELVAWLDARPASCELLLSADTLIYFGALEPFAAAARRALRGGGRLIFTVEAQSDDAPADYRLHGHGRYSHHRRYLEACLCGAGLAPPEMQRVVLRREAGKPVEGWLVCALAPRAP